MAKVTAKNPAKPIALNSDVLTLYCHLGSEMARMKIEREQLRRKIMIAVAAKKKAAPGFRVEIVPSERTTVPWQSEAKRWRGLALDFGRQLGKTKKTLGKLEAVFPSMPIETLIVRRAGQEAEEEE